MSQNITYTKSQKALLAAAQSLFYKHGIKRVSVDEIYTQAGVSKMTFYRSFKDKNDVALHVIKSIINNARIDTQKIRDEYSDFKTYIIRALELKKKYTECMSAEFLQDFLSVQNPAHQTLLEEYNREAIMWFFQDIERAKSDGEISPDLKPEFIMYLMENVSKQANDPYLLSLFETPQDLIMALTKHFLCGITAPKI